MTRMRQYEQTAAQWTAQNPVLLKGELGWESGATPKAKKGDGVTAWNSLPYVILPAVDVSTLAPKASPVFTGDPQAPTPATADNDTSIATTAFVKAQGYVSDVSALAPKASPVFTGNPTAPTPATSDNDTSVATTAFVKAALLAINPIGTIFFTTVNTNPGTFIGGTWVAWGSGRVPVGVDTGQTEFDTVEETGGSKTHTHANDLAVSGTSLNQSLTAQVGGSSARLTTPDTHSHALTGGVTAATALPPYITCYMWKRTA